MARPFGASSFASLTIEGNLLAPSILKEIATQNSQTQTDEYNIPRGVTIRDELARFFRIGQASFRHLHESPSASLEATIRFTTEILTNVLDFSEVSPGGVLESGGRLFPVTLQALAGRLPMIVVSPSEGLDTASEHLRPDLRLDARRRSAATALQDWLNVSDLALWGLCTNGLQLRLLRDNPSLTRPAYLEFDLSQIFDNEDFSSFTLFWLLLHSSRFGRPGKSASECALERWREQGAKTGEVALRHLSGNVREALLALGDGFLEHPENTELRHRLASGELALSSSTGSGQSFFSQLLRLVYRLIFLLAAEDRNLLHPPETSTQLRELYAVGYSVGSLRDRAIRRAAWDPFDDRWQGLLLTFRALAHGDPRLGLPALGGLFNTSQTPDLDGLHLSNRALFRAIYSLAWLRNAATPVRVNWRDMQSEELGSVYEGLLELTPRLADTGRSLSFAEGSETKGNERKTSGSYYTPDALVQTLLDSALDPVLERFESESSCFNSADPAAHLLTVTVLDPACGSGHFLLAAARRIATRVARLRTDGVASQQDYHRALRDVVRWCIYGVDRNPMAIELSRVALWIETVEPGKPLGFLDANLRCGDSLLGIFSLDALRLGIPEEAYKPLAGDDKGIANIFKTRNRDDLRGQARLDFSGHPTSLPIPPALAAQALALRGLPEDSEQDVVQREQAFERVRSNPELTRYEVAADLYTAAFLTPKVKPTPGVTLNAEFPGQPFVPVSSHVWRALNKGTVLGTLVGTARQLTAAARAFHWPIEFPHILLNQNVQHPGFDAVLGNPPWERIKLQEQEFFAAREPAIAEAPNAAARGRLIAALKAAPEGSREWLLYQEFEMAKRTSEASSIFARVSPEDGGRFPLTGRGDINTYALFAEVFSDLVNSGGRSGVIVPTGIATDATTAPFFASLVESRRLALLIDFENSKPIFPNVHRSYKFCLLTTSQAIDNARFTFFLTDPEQLVEPNRTFQLSLDQIATMNPNTKTTPIFRSIRDADLTTRIYDRVPVLLNQAERIDPWKFDYMTKMFDMADSSDSFKTATELQVDSIEAGVSSVPQWLPLYEAKLINHFDHRWATYDALVARDTNLQEKCNSEFEVTPRYWVREAAVSARLASKGWHRHWLLGWRDICRATDERTVIAAFYPAFAIGHTLRNFMIPANAIHQACLCANLTCLALDYTARQKLGGTHLTVESVQQLPLLAPSVYRENDVSFIVPRVLELTYTSYSMTSFARDLGYAGEPFPWDEDRRALLRAELDAWYARAYGVSRDDLRYILDPKDVMGEDYPSETFRVLQKNEIARFGEYRTRRLVLAAWDRQAAGLTPASELQHPQTAFPAVLLPSEISYDGLPDGSWTIARPEPFNATVPAARLLAAVLAEFSRPTPRDEIGLVYAFASKPEKLTPLLQGKDRATWLRLVGTDAHPPDRRTLQMPTRVDLPFAEALSWLRSRSALREDLSKRTWQRGSGDPGLPLTGWPEGRARFVHKVLVSIGFDTLRSGLAPEDVVWEEQRRA